MENKDLLSEKTVREHLVYEGKILSLWNNEVELCDGKLTRREIVEHHGGAGILALDEDGTVYLVRQFRLAAGRELLEIPAGKLEKGEDPLEAAKRELEEECGLRAKTWTPLCEAFATPGYSTEKFYLYLAEGLEKTKQDLDEGEFLLVETLSLEALLDKIMKGGIHDAKTVMAALLAKERCLCD